MVGEALPRHEPPGKPTRTVALPPPGPSDVERWRLHHAQTVEFTEVLRDGRCRRTDRFTTRLGDTVSILAPLVGAWNLEILFLLSMHGPLRFGGLKRALGPVSSRVLTDKLRHLEAHGFLRRDRTGPHVAYVLSRHGDVVARHLHPIVFYLHHPEVARDMEPDTCPGLPGARSEPVRPFDA